MDACNLSSLLSYHMVDELCICITLRPREVAFPRPVGSVVAVIIHACYLFGCHVGVKGLSSQIHTTDVL